METKIGSMDSSRPATCDDVCSLPSNGVVSTIQSSAVPFNSVEATLGRHLARRLVQIGVNDVFSVPGDFNLTLLDHFIAEPGLNLVGCCNELNAGYAADGYARARGVGACVVTFTVGGLSVLNAIAGAYSENLPVICIVGGPNTNDYGTNRILHHTIGLPDFSQELRCFQNVTCYQAVVNNLEDAHELIDTAISTALKESKPVYISVSCNLPAIPHPTFSREPVPFSLSPKLSNQMGLEAAVEAAAEFLNKAVKPVMVGGPKMRVAKACNAFVELADACGYALAVMPSAKGLVPEHHPHFIGTYWGAVSTAFCAEIVESADAYLFAGPIFNDYSSVGYSLLLKREKAIIVQPDRVVIGQSEKDLLLELKNNLIYDSSLSTKLVQWNDSTDYCQWSGVKCDNKSRVSSLDLSSESISGGINGTLFRFVHLQSLNLAQNSFDSIELPLGFGKLSELRYLNLSNSGFAGQIPLDFSDLTRLVVLDLSTVYSSIKLENPNLEKLIHNLTRLRELYLDGVNISAKGYDWCNAISSSLPNLRVLSLSNSYLTGSFNSSLLKLQSLSIIRLDGNTFSAPFPVFFADFPNLRVLTLSSCDLFGMVPGKLFQIKSLQMIDLSNNRDLEGSFPQEFPLNGSLQKLLLSYTNFSGYVSESIGNLRMLSNVDLRACGFSGQIPSSIKNLTHLVNLDLSVNQFLGSVPSFALLKYLTVLNLRRNNLTGQVPNSLWEGLENLNFLDLSENSLEGEIPASLFVLPSLKVLYLSNNNFYGSIRDSRSSSSSPLEVLDLRVNNFEGPIPRFLFELQNLSSLSLSSNKFSGSIELTDFQKLTNLVNLDLSYNNLSVHVNGKVSLSSLFPRLGTLMLASCKLRKVPLLMNQSSLMMLDLSHNQIDGEIPNWIWEAGSGYLRFVNLSHNQFNRFDLRRPVYFDLLDLSSNNFSSSLPANIGNFLKPIVFFSIANNKIIGTIPPSLCNPSRLQTLDLSNNSLHGKIPSCLLESTHIRVLNLGGNNLSGDIPDAFPVGCGLETLDFSWNVLQGKFPKSLTRCTEMEVLNLSHNVLSGRVPASIGNVQKLESLDLSFNGLSGEIPKQTFPESSFLGNEGLCGSPLNKTCSGVISNKFYGLVGS